MADPYREPRAAGARRHFTFSATEVEIVGLAGNLVIRVNDVDTTTMVISGGSDERVGAIRAEVVSDVLRVDDEGTTDRADISVRGGSHSIHVSGSRVGSISISGGGSVTVNGRRIDVSDAPEEEPITVTLTVPRGTPIALGGVDGNTTIGDVDGPLDAALSGVGNLTCGATRKTKVRLSGSARATFAKVVGDLDATVSGTGSVVVSGGTIDALDASVSGTGSITVNAVAERGSLSVSGVGNIHVSCMRRAPRKRISGIGGIHVGSVG